MLVVPTYVEKSEINGFGLFASKKIKEGSVVWMFEPNADQVFSPSEYEDLLIGLSKINRDRFDRWTYKRDGVYILCADNAKFFNHSDNPNCGGDNMSVDFALRDIEAGEELTNNYLEFDEAHEKKGIYGERKEKSRKTSTKRNRL